ncbi:MAG: AsnC family transcriptional regulator [Nitrososphaerota archaeon]|nr:AsnC family transcriptional regulator [Nitrososphaerota archaeon]
MDELDVRILRALIFEGAVAPSMSQVNESLSSIAKRLEADDAKVSYRYRRMLRSGTMSDWLLMTNPGHFGCGLTDVLVDVEPESGKDDMIRKLRVVHEVVGIIDFYGRALRLTVITGGEESKSRTIELVSRITNAETLTQVRWALPRCRMERFTETDVAVIRSLARDARKSFVDIAKELRLSARTVRNRAVKLRSENAVFTLPNVNLGGTAGLIPAVLSYSYANGGAKEAVDRAMLSRFDASYLWGGFSDPDSGWVLIGASTMVEVREGLKWAKAQPGLVGARSDIVTKTLMFPEKLAELLVAKEQRGTPPDRRRAGGPSRPRSVSLPSVRSPGRATASNLPGQR